MEVFRTNLEQAKTVFAYGNDDHFEDPANSVIVNVFVSAIVEGTPELRINAMSFLEKSLVSEDPKMRDRALVIYERLNAERPKNEAVVGVFLTSGKQRLGLEFIRATARRTAIESTLARIGKLLR